MTTLTLKLLLNSSRIKHGRAGQSDTENNSKALGLLTMATKLIVQMMSFKRA